MKLEAAVCQQFRIYRISGCVGWEDARLLDLELAAALQKGSRPIAIQLEGIKHLSSSAIGVVVNHIRGYSEPNRIYLLTQDSYVRDLFDLTGLPMVIPDHILLSIPDFMEATGIQSNTPIEWTVQLDTWNQRPTTLCI